MAENAGVPKDDPDLAVVVEQVECVACGAGARGPNLAVALPDNDWVRVGEAWLCPSCASSPLIVTHVSISQGV